MGDSTLSGGSIYAQVLGGYIYFDTNTNWAPM